MIRNLKKMEQILMDYSVALSKVLKVDVDIVSRDFIRIAGTGIYEGQLGQDITGEGFIYRKAIESKEMQVVSTPREHELCENCPQKDECEELFEMCAPIIFDGEVLGVIGLVCFTEEQKDHIVGNLETYIDFIKHYSDLIAAKVHEFNKNQENIQIIKVLNEIVDKIEEGVLIVNRDSTAAAMNGIAKSILNVSESQLSISLTKLEKTENRIFNRCEYLLDFNNKTFLLAGKIYDLNIGEFSKLFIFKDANRLKDEIFTLASMKNSKGIDKIIGNSSLITEVKNNAKSVARLGSTVFIGGESGTGKELFAKALHEESDRSDKPFVAINCGAIPENLIESELFGYVGGAFSGAHPDGKVGKFELANQGTVFLDEIGDLPLYLQVKLLRVIESREIVRLGSNKTVEIDVRLITATNKDLGKMIEDGLFREDLYYRLHVIPLELPPLRDRGYDIRILANHFIERYAQIFCKKVNRIDEEFWNVMMAYDWPGNVRELKNTVEFILSLLDPKGVIGCEHLPSRILHAKNNQHDFKIDSFDLAHMERRMITAALDSFGTNQKSKERVAKELGVGIATLYRKIKKYNIEA